MTRSVLEIDDVGAAEIDRARRLAGDGAQSRGVPQAHHRLPAFRGLLRFLLEEAAP